MVVLFLLFPRIGPLWGVPQDGGWQDRPVEHDAHGRDGRDRAATTRSRMRMRFDGAAPPPAEHVLPRPGADALRRPRVDAARPAVRAASLPARAAELRDCAARRCATR